MERRGPAHGRHVNLVFAGLFELRKIGGVKLLLRVRVQNRAGGFAFEGRRAIGDADHGKIRARRSDRCLFLRVWQVTHRVEANLEGFGGGLDGKRQNKNQGTTNNQSRKAGPNVQQTIGRPFIGCWIFDVGCSMFYAKNQTGTTRHCSTAKQFPGAKASLQGWPPCHLFRRQDRVSGWV